MLYCGGEGGICALSNGAQCGLLYDYRVNLIDINMIVQIII